MTSSFKRILSSVYIFFFYYCVLSTLKYNPGTFQCLKDEVIPCRSAASIQGSNHDLVVMEAKEDVKSVVDISLKMVTELIAIFGDNLKKGIEVVISKSSKQFDAPQFCIRTPSTQQPTQDRSFTPYRVRIHN